MDQCVGECRCLICTRCKKNTGNSTQGHYWAWCHVLKRDSGTFHFCCPDDCELHPSDAA